MDNKQICKYKYNGFDYITSCEKELCVHDGLYDKHGFIEENHFKFCPYCGKEIEEIKDASIS